MINVSDWLVDDESAAHRVSPDTAAAAEKLERPRWPAAAGTLSQRYRKASHFDFIGGYRTTWPDSWVLIC